MAELFTEDLADIFKMEHAKESYRELLDSFAKYKYSYFEKWSGDANDDQKEVSQYHDIPLPGNFLIFVVNQFRNELARKVGSNKTNKGTAGRKGFTEALQALNKKLSGCGRKYMQWAHDQCGQTPQFPSDRSRAWLIKIIEDEEDEPEIMEMSDEDTDDDDVGDNQLEPPSVSKSTSIALMSKPKHKKTLSLFSGLNSLKAKIMGQKSQQESNQNMDNDIGIISDEVESDEDDEDDEDGSPRLLSLHHVVWRWMFDSIVNPIVAHVVNILATQEMRDTKYIFLVGGFANSKYFQMRMQQEFGQNPKYPNLSVEIPSFPGLCVVDGAARYGLTPDFVKVRTMPRTYGLRSAMEINQEIRSKYDPKFIARYSYKNKVCVTVLGVKMFGNDFIDILT